MTDQNQKAEGASNAGTSGESIIKKIVADAGAEGGQKHAGNAPIVDPQPPKELELDTGNGVKRRVPVEELGKLFNEREKIATAKQALDERLAELGDLNSIRALQARVRDLDPARRQKVLELLQGGGAEDGDEGGEDAENLEAAFGDGDRRNGSRSNGQADGHLNERLDRIDQVLQALATRENMRLQSERSATAGERLDKLMTEYPVFKGPQNDVARAFAKDSIMTQFAAQRSNDPAVLEGLVQHAASKLQELVTRTQQSEREGMGVPRQMEVTGVPKGGFKKQDLKSGKVRQLAERLIQSTQGPAG